MDDHHAPAAGDDSCILKGHQGAGKGLPGEVDVFGGVDQGPQVDMMGVGIAAATAGLLALKAELAEEVTGDPAFGPNLLA